MPDKPPPPVFDPWVAPEHARAARHMRRVGGELQIGEPWTLRQQKELDRIKEFSQPPQPEPPTK